MRFDSTYWTLLQNRSRDPLTTTRINGKVRQMAARPSITARAGLCPSHVELVLETRPSVFLNRLQGVSGTWDPVQRPETLRWHHTRYQRSPASVLIGPVPGPNPGPGMVRPVLVRDMGPVPGSVPTGFETAEPGSQHQSQDRSPTGPRTGPRTGPGTGLGTGPGNPLFVRSGVSRRDNH